MSRALSDEQVGMILRRLTVIRERVAPPGVVDPNAYAQGLADGMTMAYEHAAAIIGDVIGESPAPVHRHRFVFYPKGSHTTDGGQSVCECGDVIGESPAPPTAAGARSTIPGRNPRRV